MAELQVLGTFTALIEERRVILRPSVRRIIALLAVHGPMHRSDAAGVLWPDLTQERALANLRTALWRARTDGPGLVTEEGDVVGIPDVRVDLSAVREWAQRAVRGEEPWMPPPQRSTHELLPGWGAEWLIGPREELRLHQLYALEAAGGRLLTAGRFGEAAGLALAAVTVDPLRESATRLLIEIHIREGNRPDAVRRFDTYQRRLRREMACEPGPSLTALVRSYAGM